MDDLGPTAVLRRASDGGIPFNWMRAPHNDADTASIYAVENGWRVSTTNERATEESIEYYADRADAVEDFLDRVRAFLRAHELRKTVIRPSTRD